VNLFDPVSYLIVSAGIFAGALVSSLVGFAFSAVAGVVLLHILPHRFVRIRYYGLFANRHRDRQLERCRALLGAAASARNAECDEREDWESVYQRVTGKDPMLCAECGHGHLRRVRKLPALARRPPP